MPLEDVAGMSSNSVITVTQSQSVIGSTTTPSFTRVQSSSSATLISKPQTSEPLSHTQTTLPAAKPLKKKKKKIIDKRIFEIDAEAAESSIEDNRLHPQSRANKAMPAEIIDLTLDDDNASDPRQDATKSTAQASAVSFSDPSHASTIVCLEPISTNDPEYGSRTDKRIADDNTVPMSDHVVVPDSLQDTNLMRTDGNEHMAIQSPVRMSLFPCNERSPSSLYALAVKRRRYERRRRCYHAR
jgi:hypothetical protein